MPGLRIDIGDLIHAMSDHDGEWVLDTQTGQVLMSEWIRDEGLRADMGLDLDEGDAEDADGDWGDPLDSGRFMGIDAIASHESFRWMEDFADRQEGRVRERLLDALDKPKPFRRFKDALFDFPQVRDAWFHCENQQLEEEAQAWLQESGLDAELVRPAPPPS